MTRPSFVAVGAGVAVAVLVLIVGTGLGWWSTGSSPAPRQGLEVQTSLDPASPFFGDAVTAEIDVAVYSSATGLRVVPAFGPLAMSGRPVVTQSQSGGLESVRYRYAIQCVSEDCLPLVKPRALRLPPVVVSARVHDRVLTVKASWPALTVVSRLSGDGGGLRRPAALLQPMYGISPGVLADVLTAAAAVLALLTLAVVGREAVRLVRRHSTVRMSPLEAALLYTRQSARRRDAADRRKALALLAQTLDAEGDSALADAAASVAWSDAAPTPERALELADEVETAGRDGR